MLSIAIVGTGPTGLYTFAALTRCLAKCRITLFEKAETIGVGTPYSLDTATKAMLANIASIEIPPLQIDYLDWMQAQPVEFLLRYGLDPANLNERLFTPRLMLGTYFHDQFHSLIAAARAAGHEVTVNTGAEVSDILATEDGLRVIAGDSAVFDRVILASGHSFDDDVQNGRYFPNPWSGLIQTDIPAVRVGVLGTSLSAIDAAMAVATQHGRFVAGKGDDLRYDHAREGLQITLMSRSGVLPEADFYCPIPYAPLEVMTEAALKTALGGSAPLDAVFNLFREEITTADPGYAARIGLERLTADDFAAAYFADRLARDPFRWARDNLAAVEANRRAKVTVGWRYAILRMHERVEAVLAQLPETDRARFDAGLKRVFIDNYAAVPPESIRRLLALRNAGVLSVAALGQDYDLEIGRKGTVITAGTDRLDFDVFIDARGQKPLESEDLPFASLRRALCAAGQNVPELDDGYALCDVPDYGGRLVLAALPYLMHDRPFMQGITASAEIGAAIAKRLMQAAGRPTRRWRWGQMLEMAS